MNITRIRNLFTRGLCRAPKLSGFLRNKRGSVAIEFAMIGVPLFGLLTAILQTGVVFIQSMQLQQATQHAARLLMTSQSKLPGTSTSISGMSYTDFLTQAVCNRLTSMITCSKLQMKLTTYTSSQTNWQSLATQAKTNVYVNTGYNGAQTITPPAAGNIVVMQVVYPMNPIIAILAGTALVGGGIVQINGGQTLEGSQYVYLLYGTYAFQVEP
jgi:Flp pilus assembly protein TadG